MLDKNIIIHCDKCTGNKECPDCLGHQNYITLGNYLVYWEKDYGDLNILIDQTRKIIKVVINIILILSLVLGIVALFYHFYLLKAANSNLLMLDNWRGVYLLVFWISLFLNMFLFYRVKKNRFDIEKVVNVNSFNEDRSKIVEKNIYKSLNKDSFVLHNGKRLYWT